MNFLIALLIASAGGLIGIKIGLPQGALLGALIAVALVNTTGVFQIQRLPSPAIFIMYALIGIELGAGVDRSTFAALSRAWVPAVLFVVLLLLMTVGASILMVRFFGIDLATALFGTSPGAISGITALAADTKANVAVVVAIHTLRVTALVIAMPIIYRVLSK